MMKVVDKKTWNINHSHRCDESEGWARHKTVVVFANALYGGWGGSTGQDVCVHSFWSVRFHVAGTDK